MTPRQRDLQRAQEAEIARWPGVTFHREMGGKHPRIVLAFKGRTRIHGHAGSSGDYRGDRNSIAQLRAAIAFLGATRTVKAHKLETA